jgi:hypothetical protein
MALADARGTESNNEMRAMRKSKPLKGFCPLEYVS